MSSRLTHDMVVSQCVEDSRQVPSNFRVGFLYGKHHCREKSGYKLLHVIITHVCILLHVYMRVCECGQNCL